MRAGGRVRRGTLALASLYACITLTASNDYGVPIEIKVWDTGRTPLAHMVDVTNGFGLRVLAEHNFLNDNNIAFSPYGLMGIMVALYEGVDGDSSYQIQRGMQLPWNRNVMRIGFRDIHRTLKTYFVPEEGFLAGLALNNENVTFNDNYKKILRFYGFDLENDQIPTLAPTNGTTNATSTEATSTTTASPTSAAMPAATNTENLADTSTPPSREETTPNPNAETFSPVDTRTSIETTTSIPSSAPNSEQTTSNDLSSLSDGEISTTPSSPPMTERTTSPPPITETTLNDLSSLSDGVISTTPSSPPMTESTTSPPPITETTSTPMPDTTSMMTTPAVETTTQVPTTITVQPSTQEGTTQTTTMMQIVETDGESIAQQTSQATSALPDDPTTNEVSSTNMGSVGTDTTSPDSSTTSTSAMTETDMTTVTTESSTTEASTTDDTMTTFLTTMATESPLETLQRRKKSIVDFIFKNPPYIDDYFIYRSYQIGPEDPTAGYDENMFLANGLKNIQVTYMNYDTVLEHAYLPHLEASAVRLPLDSERYYLLVVLPDRRGAAEIGRLLSRMARESDLADVYAALRPTRVRAIVPSFMVKGHVTLTTDLQKLGIRDVFEPRQRDFTLMTHQAGVYVRSIEQAVSVAIRKYKPDDPKKNRYVANRVPVKFYATYPFLYFVMDSSIHVALMAGKMVDPLNSRIL